MKTEFTTTKDVLIFELSAHLDSRDKRYTFLKCCFNGVQDIIKLEGSVKEASINIYEYFKKNNSLGEIAACMNTYYNTDIYLNMSDTRYTISKEEYENG